MQELEGRTEAEPWKNIAVYWFAQITFSYSPEQPLQGTHCGLNPPSSIINQEHAPTDLPIGQFNGSISQLKFPLS